MSHPSKFHSSTDLVSQSKHMVHEQVQERGRGEGGGGGGGGSGAAL